MKTSNRNTNLNFSDWVALICLGAFLLLFNYNSKAQGNVEWKINYTNTFSQYDKGLAIVSDDDCNSYIAGTTWNGINLDYLIVKLNHKGDTVWSQAYNGTGDGEDVPVAIALDDNGNVFVTGSSIGLVTGFDFATIKLNNTTGNILNVARNEYPLDNKPSAMFVSSSGSVDVTGYGINIWGSNTNEDILTIRYENNLTELCYSFDNAGSANRDSAKALALDVSTNTLFVVGSSKSTFGATMQWQSNKLTLSAPTCVKQSTFDGGVNGTYSANATLASNGKLFIAGTWEGAMAIRRYDNTSSYFLNNFSFDHVISGTGTAIDGFTKMVIDPFGQNIYVCGYQDGDAGSGINNNIVVAKYSISAVPGAGPLWVSPPFNGTGNGDDMPVAIFLDNSPVPNVYVAGYTTKTGGNKEIILLKYDANGSGIPVDTILILNTTAFDEFCTGATRDNYGNIILTGYNDDPSGHQLIAAKICNNSFTPAITWTVLNTLSATSGDSYQWFLNGNLLPGEINQTIDITNSGNGNYLCEVTKYCCTFNTSMVVATVGMNDLTQLNKQLQIFPNPASDYIDIIWNLSEPIERFKIIDMSGRVVVDNVFVIMDGRLKVKLDEINAGVYFIKINSKHGSMSSKIIKQ
ncbi:MAG: T9SS type A sorting domain-containing protein [Bacteroidetes bacterium]|nr:T9SS type A sorting domain-containing protein [Bacteroidota bacterium]